MTRRLEDLLAVSRLIRDRELAALAAAEREITIAARNTLRDRIARNREAVDRACDPAMYAAFETWLRVARRDAAKEAVRREKLLETAAIRRERAARALGRTLALERLVQDGGSTRKRRG